jgi:hypothetical protein
MEQAFGVVDFAMFYLAAQISRRRERNESYYIAFAACMLS